MPRSAIAHSAPRFGRRAVRFSLLAIGIAACACSVAREAYGQYYWDPNHMLTTTGGGSGTWDLSTANWFDPSGNQDVALLSAQTSLYDAYFAGSGGTVTLWPHWIEMNQMVLNSGGYLFNGTSTSTTNVLDMSVFYLYGGLIQSVAVTGVNEISVPISVNGSMYVNGGTLKISSTNPLEPNSGASPGVSVASGATFECVGNPQSTALFYNAYVDLSGTFQLDLQGSAPSSAPIPFNGTVGLHDGSKVVFTGAPDPATIGYIRAVAARFGDSVNSVISGPAGTVLYLNQLDASQSAGAFTLENDIDIHARAFWGWNAIFNKTGTGRLSVEGVGIVDPQGIIDVQQGIFAVVGTATSNPIDRASLALDGGTLSLEAASGTPVYDNPLSVTNRGGLLAVGAPSVTLGSSANGVTLQGAGLQIDTSPSGVGNHLTIAGNISGAGQAITVHGTGALTLAGQSTVAVTTAHASFLEVNGVLNSDTVTIDTAGMLGGHGTISGSVSLLDRAILAPSWSSTNSAGSTLTFLGPVTFISPDTGFSVKVAGADPALYDQVNFGDSLSIQGNLIVDDINGPLAPGSKLWIMDGLIGSSPVSGQFLYNGALLQSGTEFTLSDGTTYEIDYNLPGDPAGTGNDVVLTAVPEPACAPLLAGALMLLARRKRIAWSGC